MLKGVKAPLWNQIQVQMLVLYFLSCVTWGGITGFLFTVLSCLIVSNSCDPTDCSLLGSSVHGDSPCKNTRLPCPSPRDLPNPGIKLPTLRVDSLPTEASGKPKSTGVGSLSLLQGIFLTQESNWDPLHCRQSLYQLHYQGSPSCCYLWPVTTLVTGDIYGRLTVSRPCIGCAFLIYSS